MEYEMPAPQHDNQTNLFKLKYLLALLLLALTTLFAGCDKLITVYIFDLTRLAADGSVYTGNNRYQEQPWPCARDNKSGLVWEVKTATPGLHAGVNTYTWYSSDEKTDGGWEGKQNGGVCAGSRCDTEAFIKATNAERLCGYDNWRLPSKDDLGSLVDATVRMPGPTLPVEIFPNTQKAAYLSATPFRMHKTGIWAWRFDQGADLVVMKDVPAYVRLVRGTAKSIENKQPTQE